MMLFSNVFVTLGSKICIEIRGTRDQIANIHWIIKKAREFQKSIYFCFIEYAKAFDCVAHNKLENSSRDGNTMKYLAIKRNEVLIHALT